MQFAKVQGRGLAALGLLLLMLQGYLYLLSSRPVERSVETPPSNVSSEHKTMYVPGLIGVLALSLGVYLVIAQSGRGRNEEIQPPKTSSGFPM